MISKSNCSSPASRMADSMHHCILVYHESYTYIYILESSATLRAALILRGNKNNRQLDKEGEVQPAIGHGAKSLRNCAEGMQKQPEGRHRAPRGAPGSTQDRPKGLLETPGIAKKVCWRHPGHAPGNGSVPESSKAIFTSALYPFWTSILASFLCRIIGFRRLFISGFLHALRGHFYWIRKHTKRRFGLRLEVGLAW